MKFFKSLAAGILTALLLGSSLLLTGCPASNPVQTATQAETEDKAEVMAFALHNSYVVVAEKALSLAQKAETPVEVKRTLIDLHERASPVAKALKAAAEEVRKWRELFERGMTPEDKVANALAALNQLLTVENINKLNALAAAVGG